eukprot:s872_g24.t1
MASTSSWALSMQRVEQGVGVRAQCPGRDVIECYTDADWAGCRSSRKSTSAMALFVNSVFLMSRSARVFRNRDCSCESEYTAMVGGTADMLYVGAALEFLTESQPSLHLFCDSSSARQLAQRRGWGKIRHLQLKLLWLQAKLAEDAFKLHPVPTKENLSDLMTKSCIQVAPSAHQRESQRSHDEVASCRAHCIPAVPLWYGGHSEWE